MTTTGTHVSKGAHTHTQIHMSTLKIKGVHFLLKMVDGKATEDKRFMTVTIT